MRGECGWPRFVSVTTLAAVLWIAATAPAEEPDLGGEWTTLQRAGIERLHALARWCGRARLFACRADAYERVLRHDPEDEAAREKLRYQRNAEGHWERPEDYDPPRNLRRGRSDYENKLTGWSAWFEKEALLLQERALAAHERRLACRIITFALRVLPGTDTLHIANDEVRGRRGSEACWVLKETGQARRRRRLVSGSARLAVRRAKEPEVAEEVAKDGLGDVRWACVRAGSGFRIVGTAGLNEMLAIHKLCVAAEPTFRAAFDLDPHEGPDRRSSTYTVYVLPRLDEGNRFLGLQPGVTPRWLALCKPSAVTGLPGRLACVIKGGTLADRLEAGPRHLLGLMAGRAFGLTDDRGWASRGLGDYLVYPIAGTRRLAPYTDERAGHTEPQPGASDTDPTFVEHDDWRSRGLTVLKSKEKPNLCLLAGKDVNDLTQRDVLYGYCLVAWLIEGHPEMSGQIFHEIGRQEEIDLESIFLRHLAMDIVTVERRLTRWLEEVASGAR